ncbi:hypothetical protein KY334_05030 [Candidatus Woesearchaeota archaeon]|nr:hypothetical protein [Candidatus Woesearchaeota archaeon]
MYNEIKEKERKNNCGFLHNFVYFGIMSGMGLAMIFSEYQHKKLEEGIKKTSELELNYQKRIHEIDLLNISIKYKNYDIGLESYIDKRISEIKDGNFDTYTLSNP